MHYYDSVLVVERKFHAVPVVKKTGRQVFTEENGEKQDSLLFHLLVTFNKILRFFRLPSFKFNS